MSHDAPNAAQPLNLSVHDLPTPSADPDAAARTRVGRIKMALILLACASPVIASYFTYYVIRPTGQPGHGVLIQPPVDLPPAASLPGMPPMMRRANSALRGSTVVYSR